MVLYETAWHVLMPLVLLFLWRRGQREPLYRQHWHERWGQASTTLVKPIWVHSASLGELRGAAPLVQGLLDAGYPIMLTTLTPAGRTAAEVLFQQAISTGRLQVAYAPFEWRSVVSQFISAVQPRMVMMTEIDTWPGAGSDQRCFKPTIWCFANLKHTLSAFAPWAAVRLWWLAKRVLICPFHPPSLKPRKHC